MFKENILGDLCAHKNEINAYFFISIEFIFAITGKFLSSSSYSNYIENLYKKSQHKI